MTKYIRHIEIMDYLERCRFATGPELADRFMVHENTIYNDILELSLIYPINSKQGNGGGYYLEKWFHLYEHYLTEEQQNLLERLKDSVDIKDAETLESIIQKFGRR